MLHEAVQGQSPVAPAAFESDGFESVDQPMKYYENNVGGTLNLLAAMSLANVRQIVFSSSAAVYAPSEKSAIDENDATEPLSPYGATKLLSEKLISTVGQAEQISHISLRYFNVVGAGEDRLGDNARDNLVPRVFNAVATKIQPEIFGTDYPTPDGTCIRDYIHVEDLADAHIKALDYLATGGKSLACNVGTGKGTSVLEVLDMAEQVSGRKVPHVITHRRPGDPAFLVSDASKFQRDTGYLFPESNLYNIISSQWEYYNNDN